tara:strand:+ start:370 stop:600 length:231 start_codon:yes stop_codon:yes gene_type:complete
MDLKSEYLSVLTGCAIVVLKGVQLQKVLSEKYKEVNFKKRIRREGVYTKREVKYKTIKTFNKTVERYSDMIKYRNK